jgi:hypothetical protein
MKGVIIVEKVETLYWNKEFDRYKSQMVYDFAIGLATANTKQGEDVRHFYLRFCDAFEDAERLVKGPLQFRKGYADQHG